MNSDIVCTNNVSLRFLIYTSFSSAPTLVYFVISCLSLSQHIVCPVLPPLPQKERKKRTQKKEEESEKQLIYEL